LSKGRDDVHQQQFANKARRVRMLASAAVAGASVLGLVAGGGLAAATTAPSYSFRVTGAGSGSLHNGQYAGCLNGNGQTDVNDIVGTVSHFTKDVMSWDLTINEKNNGTFKLTGSFTKDPRAEFAAMPKNENFTAVQNDQFFAQSGTVTIKGHGNTGSISASFMSTSQQTMHITGHWTCES
jgi:hypothetical protein